MKIKLPGSTPLRNKQMVEIWRFENIDSGLMLNLTGMTLIPAREQQNSLEDLFSSKAEFFSVEDLQHFILFF